MATTTLTTDDGLTLAATWHRRAETSDPSEPRHPVVVAVHGYPDDQRVWDAMIPHLLDHADVLTYDTRGAGRSDAPSSRGAYALDRLHRDVDQAVLTAAADGRGVHLLAHDWGSIQAWQAVTGNGAASRVSSFTTISGPCLDHASRWLRAAAHGPARDRLAFAQQAAASSYIAFFRTPTLPELAIRSGVLGRLLQRGDGVARAPRDMINGLELYRANMGARRRSASSSTPRTSTPSSPRSPRRTDVSTQVIVPTRDRYVREPIATYGAAFAASSRVRHLDAGHWVVRTHARQVAALVIEHAGL